MSCMFSKTRISKEDKDILKKINKNTITVKDIIDYANSDTSHSVEWVKNEIRKRR